jgi:hypothetical protein
MKIRIDDERIRPDDDPVADSHGRHGAERDAAGPEIIADRNTRTGAQGSEPAAAGNAQGGVIRPRNQSGALS